MATIIFPHIPKSAGTSLKTQLEQSHLKLFLDYDHPRAHAIGGLGNANVGTGSSINWTSLPSILSSGISPSIDTSRPMESIV